MGAKLGLFGRALSVLQIAFCGLNVSRFLGVYLPLDFDLSCYIVLLMWVGYTVRQRGLEPSVDKPLLYWGWNCLACSGGSERA